MKSILVAHRKEEQMIVSEEVVLKLYFLQLFQVVSTQRIYLTLFMEKLKSVLEFHVDNGSIQVSFERKINKNQSLKFSLVFTELFLESVSNPYGSSNQQTTFADNNNLLSGQMVIAQISGGPNKVFDLQGGPVLSDSEPFRSSKLCTKVATGSTKWCNDFHTYTLEWKAGKFKILFFLFNYKFYLTIASFWWCVWSKCWVMWAWMLSPRVLRIVRIINMRWLMMMWWMVWIMMMRRIMW